MIKFFRKIRQKLISESKFSKYLIYAIGEIVLVMIGILLALQINTWNSIRVDRSKEQVFLNQIFQEFTENAIQLENRKTQHKEIFAAAIRIVDLFRKGEILKSNLDTLAEDMFLLIHDYSYNPTNGSIDALVNSASFGLIQNQELRLLLLQWKDISNDYMQLERIAIEQNANYYKPFLAGNFSRNLNNIPRYDLKAANFDQSILQSNEFENQIIERMAGVRNVLYGGNMEDLENHLSKMIDLIKYEIEK